MEEERYCKVCVTGGAGYIGSSLVKKLLDEGYAVHTTLRDLNDHTKVELLKSFPGADKRLKIFEANIYKPEEFEAAIQGCEFVFHVATPLLHSEGYKHTNRVDATVDAARSIATACVRSGTVRRLVYTASVMAASPLKDDGSGYKDFMDESCWTPLDLCSTIPYNNDLLEEYTKAKTLAEKELLTFGGGEMEVVTLACGLVGGGDITPYLSGSVIVFLSQLTNNEFALNSLKFLQQLCGKIPIVHLEDVCNAHVFCIKEKSMKARFLCANAYVSMADTVSYYQKKYPEFSVKGGLECTKCETKWGSDLLAGRGFQYKYDWKMVLDDCISCGRKDGILSL